MKMLKLCGKNNTKNNTEPSLMQKPLMTYLAQKKKFSLLFVSFLISIKALALFVVKRINNKQSRKKLSEINFAFALFLLLLFSLRVQRFYCPVQHHD